MVWYRWCEDDHLEVHGGVKQQRQIGLTTVMIIALYLDQRTIIGMLYVWSAV